MKLLKSTKFSTYLIQPKHQLIALVFCLTSYFSYGQEYYHGLGIQLDIGFFNQEYNQLNGNFSESFQPSVPGIFYKATLALTDRFAVSAYPFVGFSGSFNSRSGSSGSIGIQLPIVAEFYFGDIDSACFFVGGGGSYASLGSSESGSGTVFGPQLSLGGQFEIAGKLIGIRGAFTLGLNSSDPIAGVEYTKDSSSLASIGVYYGFGY